MNWPVRMSAAVLLLCLAASPAAAQTTLDEQIDAAIERGVQHLWSTQRDSGLFSDLDPQNIPRTNRYPGDRTIMALVALAYAGENLDKPQMQKGLKALLELELEKTYLLGFRVIMLAELYRQADKKQRRGLRMAIKLDVDKLVDFQKSFGAWDYTKNTAETSWDFSNTQIAVLALREAVLCGVEVDLEAFRRVQKLYLEKQLDDGGWNYGRPGSALTALPSYGSMSAAAVASLFICRDALNPGLGCPCSGGKSRGRRDRQVQDAINRGVEWLGENFQARANPGRGSWQHHYWLYAAERVGIHTGMKYFGDHNWYLEGAKLLLSQQGGAGNWGSFDQTSFALLFLVKGRGPILMNKLQLGDDWDLHPRDAANLAEYVGNIKEQRFNWQAIHLGIPVEEMHDAPILYISLESPVELSDEQKKKLRDYTDTGGTILFEASCGNRDVAKWWEERCKEIWPEWEFQHIGKNHALWQADLQIKVTDRVPVLLRGLDDGMRTFLFYSPRDISCKWHTKSFTGGEPLFKMGYNLYAYATDRVRIRGRLSTRITDTGPKYSDQSPSWNGGRNTLNIARLKHGGRWHVNRRYHPWTLLAEDLRKSMGIELKELDPIDAGQEIPAEVSMLYLGGRDLLELPEATAQQLKKYLSGSGYLFAEGIAGDSKFDTQFRKMVETAGLTLRPLEGSHPVMSGRFDEGIGYAIEKPEYTFILRSDRVGKKLPELHGIYLGQRMVGLYSPFDIMFSQTGCKAFNSRGYAADDARALAINVALAACQRNRPPADTPQP